MVEGALQNWQTNLSATKLPNYPRKSLGLWNWNITGTTVHHRDDRIAVKMAAEVEMKMKSKHAKAVRESKNIGPESKKL